VNIAALPAGVIPGINYIDNQTVTLVLHDPPKAKEHVFVIGDFNDWSLKDAGYMNSTADGEYYWKTISGLTSGEEYAYQYYIDGELRLADPYTEKVLDPWNDHYIPSTIFPGP
jgi:1,4-alpha-glucan branching enzyme